jgi:hypothetical protein
MTLTRTVCFEVVTRLRLLLLLVLALFCLRDASAKSALAGLFPTRQKVIVAAPATNSPAKLPPPVAKLPPPVAPGTDPNQPIFIHNRDLPAGVEIEKNPPPPPLITDKPAEPKPSGPDEAELARQARIKAERERLNHNALLWQEDRAAHGSATAQRSLAMRYLTGDGVEKDETKGMDLLRKAAAGGDSAAKKELAKREHDSAKKE